MAATTLATVTPGQEEFFCKNGKPPLQIKIFTGLENTVEMLQTSFAETVRIFLGNPLNRREICAPTTGLLGST